MAETRLYKVRNKKDPGAKARLVEATSQAQAIGHVVKDTYEASPATPKDVAEMYGYGTKSEKAGEEPGA